MRSKTIRYSSAGVLAIIVVFLILQYIPYGKNHTNPAIVRKPQWDSQQTSDLAKRACFDCHSNETVWPWYSNVAPISWLLYHDVSVGRQRMNFSDWQNYYFYDAREISSAVAEGEMPPIQYLIIHKNARLSGTEKTQLIEGLTKTIVQ